MECLQNPKLYLSEHDHQVQQINNIASNKTTRLDYITNKKKKRKQERNGTIQM